MNTKQKPITTLIVDGWRIKFFDDHADVVHDGKVYPAWYTMLQSEYLELRGEYEIQIHANGRVDITRQFSAYSSMVPDNRYGAYWVSDNHSLEMSKSRVKSLFERLEPVLAPLGSAKIVGVTEGHITLSLDGADPVTAIAADVAFRQEDESVMLDFQSFGSTKHFVRVIDDMLLVMVRTDTSVRTYRGTVSKKVRRELFNSLIKGRALRTLGDYTPPKPVKAEEDPFRPISVHVDDEHGIMLSFFDDCVAVMTRSWSAVSYYSHVDDGDLPSLEAEGPVHLRLSPGDSRLTFPIRHPDQLGEVIIALDVDNKMIRAIVDNARRFSAMRAKFNFRLTRTKRAGEVRVETVDSVTTTDQGLFRCTNIVFRRDQFYVTLQHEEYPSQRLHLYRDAFGWMLRTFAPFVHRGLSYQQLDLKGDITDQIDSFKKVIQSVKPV